MDEPLCSIGLELKYPSFIFAEFPSSCLIKMHVTLPTSATLRLFASGNWSLFDVQPSVILVRHRERKFFFFWWEGSVRNLILCKHIKLLILKFSIQCIVYVSIHLFNYCHTTEASTIKNISISRCGDSGSTVVKALCYKSEGRWFDSRWCHWNFSLT